MGCLPSGRGQAEALHSLLTPSTVVTALSDSSLTAVKFFLEDGQACPIVDLIGRFLMMTGANSGLLASGRAMEELLALSCSEAEEDHSLLIGVSRRPGMVRALMSTLAELHLADLDPPALRAATEKATDHLKEKLDALASLDSRMRERLANLGRELPTERARRCLALEMEHLGPIKHLIVLAGRDRLPLFWKWLEWAAKQGVKVDVLIEQIPDRDDLFQHQRKPSKPTKSKAKGGWTKALFSQETAENPPEVRLIRAPDALAECEWALRLCSKLLNQGVMPHNLAIFCRDTESYAPLLTMASDRLGVAISLPLTVDLRNLGFARIVIQTLEALTGEDVRPLGRLCGSSYYPATAAERRWLNESLTEAYRQREEAWDDLARRLEEGEGPAWMTHLVTWRSEVKDAVLTLAEWQGRLKDLIGQSVVNDEAARSMATQERDLRAQNVILAALSAGAGAMPEAKYTFAGFVQRAIQLWQKDKVHLPANDYGVKVESMTERLGPCETLIVLGVVEGSLPRGRSEDPVLSDSERLELMALTDRPRSLILSSEKAEEERDEFVRLCSIPAQTLVMTWPHVKDQKNTIPAFYLKELERALDGSVTREIYGVEQIVPLPEAASHSELELAQAWHSEGAVDWAEIYLETEEAKTKVKANLEDPQPLDEVADACLCGFRAIGRHKLKWRGPQGAYEIGRLTTPPRRGDMRFAQGEDDLRLFLTLNFEDRITQSFPSIQSWHLPLLGAAKERLVDEWVTEEEKIRSWVPLRDWQFDITHRSDWFEQRGWKLPEGTARLTFTIPAGFMREDGMLILDSGRLAMSDKEWKNWLENGTETAGLAWVGMIFGLTENQTSQTVLLYRHASKSFLLHRAPDPPPRKLPSQLRGRVVTDILSPPPEIRWAKEGRAWVGKGMRVLSEADMSPQPGLWCKSCSLGEVCRRHLDFMSAGGDE